MDAHQQAERGIWTACRSQRNRFGVQQPSQQSLCGSEIKGEKFAKLFLQDRGSHIHRTDVVIGNLLRHLRVSDDMSLLVCGTFGLR